MAAVRAAKADDPVAPVLVVVGSHLQHIYLRRRLARSLTAVANVRFVTLMDLAGELALPARAEQASPNLPTLPLPDGAHVPLLEQVITEHRAHARTSSAHGLADTGMVHAVAATLRDLREGGVAAPLVANAAERPWMGALATIATAHRTALEPFNDATRRAEEAAAASTEQAAAAVQRCAPGTRQILVYGIYDANALQLRMLDLLARILPARIFLPWNAAAEPFAFVRRTVDRMRHCGMQVECLADGTAEPGRRATRAVFSCADRQAETEETVRRVLEDLAAGVPAAEIAILHRMDPVYDELICGVLDRAGVPHYRSAGQPVRRSVVGRTALNLLQLLYDEPRRGPLLELLSLPGIDLSWIETAAADTALRPASGALGGAQQGTGPGQWMGRVRLGACLPRGTCGARRRRRTQRRNDRRHARVAYHRAQSGRRRGTGACCHVLAATWRRLPRPAGALPAARGRHPGHGGNRRPHPQAGGAGPGRDPARCRCRHRRAVPAGRGDRHPAGDCLRRILPTERRVRRQRDEFAPAALSARVRDRLRRAHVSAGGTPGSAVAGCRAAADQPRRRPWKLPAAQRGAARRGAPAVRAGLPGRHRMPHPVLSAARHQLHQRAPAVELSARGGGRLGRRLSLRRGPGAQCGPLVPAHAGAYRFRRRRRRGCAARARRVRPALARPGAGRRRPGRRSRGGAAVGQHRRGTRAARGAQQAQLRSVRRHCAGSDGSCPRHPRSWSHRYRAGGLRGVPRTAFFCPACCAYVLAPSQSRRWK